MAPSRHRGDGNDAGAGGEDLLCTILAIQPVPRSVPAVPCSIPRQTRRAWTQLGWALTAAGLVHPPAPSPLPLGFMQLSTGGIITFKHT